MPLHTVEKEGQQNAVVAEGALTPVVFSVFSGYEKVAWIKLSVRLQRTGLRELVKEDQM